MENQEKHNQPKSEFLRNYNKDSTKPQYKKKKDLLEGFKVRNSFEVQINPYTKMVCSVFESETKSGLYKTEQRIGFNRIVYDGNLLFVVAETLKELGDAFVPLELRPKREGSN